MLFNKRHTVTVMVFFVLFVCLARVLFMYGSYKYRKIYLAYQFDGRVERVSYDIKGKATIIINGSSYDLSDNNWDFDHNRITKGDSLIKKKNSMIIELIKRNGQIVIQGKDELER
ncbi:hypothetical protein [Mucilaginibacter gotjawali]|uniref:Uncharacterized protein n=2 Tax=Mucilaginibacter gotjawali TaxID=1550579 RepID=A0A110AZX6_9SPHI|nr:hypothetical protein [Mucilaginibacter gotjawali]MBB3058862.1 hypothetical protein [Mucilaginibacter gotjawali]BAU52169.1 hypothetical protein MgSA37_00319 [Mucilaginibacter gotjawali]